MLYPEDIKGIVEGTFVSVEEKMFKDQKNGFPKISTIYDFTYSRMGQTFEERLFIPDMTYAVRHDLKKGDQIVIERNEKTLELAVKRDAIERCFPDFWNRIRTRVTKHEYTYHFD